MRSSKSSLFLMELVIVILFFALSSAVCVQLFAKAHMLDQETVNMNHSVIWIQNLSESFLACDGDMEKVKKLYQEWDGRPYDEYDLQLYFDKDWNPVSPAIDDGTFAYEVLMQHSDNQGSDTAGLTSSDPADRASGGYIVSAEITVTPLDTHTPLYTQWIDHYVQRKAGDPHG